MQAGTEGMWHVSAGQTPGQTLGKPWANPYGFWANPCSHQFLHATSTAQNGKKRVVESDQVIPL